MKTVAFDAGFTFDDPNLRWGDPAREDARPTGQWERGEGGAILGSTEGMKPCSRRAAARRPQALRLTVLD